MTADEAKTLSVLIVDDHQLVRETVALFLRSQQLKVSEATSVADGLAHIAAHGGFDVVLLDYGMPDMNGLDGMVEILKANQPGATVLFSGNIGRDIVVRSIQLGAHGFIPKSLPAKSLANAIRFIASGEVYLPSDYAVSPPEPEQKGSLSSQERRVLAGVCDGKTNKEIGREMDLSEVTIKMHLRSICRKLNAKNRTQAAMIARATNLV